MLVTAADGIDVGLHSFSMRWCHGEMHAGNVLAILRIGCRLDQVLCERGAAVVRITVKLEQRLGQIGVVEPLRLEQVIAEFLILPTRTERGYSIAIFTHHALQIIVESKILEMLDKALHILTSGVVGVILTLTVCE